MWFSAHGQELQETKMALLPDQPEEGASPRVEESDNLHRNPTLCYTRGMLTDLQYNCITKENYS